MGTTSSDKRYLEDSGSKSRKWKAKGQTFGHGLKINLTVETE
jgi:hypothetical protein